MAGLVFYRGLGFESGWARLAAEETGWRAGGWKGKQRALGRGADLFVLLQDPGGFGLAVCYLLLDFKVYLLYVVHAEVLAGATENGLFKQLNKTNGEAAFGAQSKRRNNTPLRALTPTCFIRSICPLYLQNVLQYFTAGRRIAALGLAPQIRVLLLLGVQLQLFDVRLQ